MILFFRLGLFTLHRFLQIRYNWMVIFVCISRVYPQYLGADDDIFIFFFLGDLKAIIVIAQNTLSNVLIGSGSLDLN